jgi:hypothetical protein
MSAKPRQSETQQINIDLVPKPHFLLAEQHQKWTVAGAISELVDNAFGQARGNAANVIIMWDHREKLLTVVDDGNGMDDISRLFQLGNTIGRSINDIGIYGSGGTKALLWLGQTVSIWTLRDGLISTAKVTWRDLFKLEKLESITGIKSPANFSNTPAQLLEAGHGTAIHIRLNPTRQLATDKIQQALCKTYAPALRQHRRIQWISHIHGKAQPAITLSDPFQVAFSQSVKLDLTLEHDDDVLNVIGEIGIIPDLKVTESKINIGYGPRVIMTTRDCFGSPEEKYSGRNIAGWLDLGDGWQQYLATTKDAIDDEPLYEKLMAAVFAQIRALLKQTEEDDMSLILDELAINLEQSINFNSDKHIEIMRNRVSDETAAGHEFGGGDGGQGRESEPGPEPGNISGRDDESGKEHLTDISSVTRITIFQDTDAKMQGMLCTVMNSGNDVMVVVNRDHVVVQTALHTRPVNRMALILLVTREIAMMLAEEHDLYKQVFAPKVTKLLDQLDEVTRQRYMARLLLDRTHTPVMNDAA